MSELVAGLPVKEYHRRYRAANKEKEAERKRRYRAANKEKVAEYRRRYYAANKEKVDERHRRYCAANKEKLAEYQRRYRVANKEKLAERQRRYYAANKEKVAERKRRYVSPSVAVADYLAHAKRVRFHSEEELRQDVLNYSKAVCGIEGNCDEVAGTILKKMKAVEK